MAAAVVSVLFVIAIGRQVARGGTGRGIPSGRFVGWVSLTLVVVLLIAFKNPQAGTELVSRFFGGLSTAASGIGDFFERL